MKHRHINTKSWTKAAIESLFERGNLQDWKGMVKTIKESELPDLIKLSKKHKIENFVSTVLSVRMKSNKRR